MDVKTKRALLFSVCLATRLALAWAAYKYYAYLPYMGALALLPAAGFLLIYAGGLRRTGAEVFGGRIWWNDLRPVHGLLYAAFAVLALARVRHAWVLLLADVAIGAAAFAAHRTGRLFQAPRS